MALVNLQRMKSFMEIPDAAETLLTKNEKEIKFSINLKVSPGKIICFDAFVVYHNVVLGPAKGGVRFFTGSLYGGNTQPCENNDL